MTSEVLIGALGLLASLLSAGVYELIQKLVGRLFGAPKAPKKAYADRLAELTEDLTKASREVDAVLSELAQVAKERADAVKQLETDLTAMEGREKELKQTIETLERTPLAVAEHFARLVAPGERRSAMRDYLLFGAGVVVSTVIGIIVQLFVK
jgi:septal ring factor EnvC (AmiA/AmiB activator)